MHGLGRHKTFGFKNVNHFQWCGKCSYDSIVTFLKEVHIWSWFSLFNSTTESHQFPWFQYVEYQTSRLSRSWNSQKPVTEKSNFDSFVQKSSPYVFWCLVWFLWSLVETIFLFSYSCEVNVPEIVSFYVFFRSCECW